MSPTIGREQPIETLLAFDFGEKRIGVASGQLISRSATPLTVLKVKNWQIDWPGITHLIDEWKPDALVVGMPTNYQGEEFGLAERVKRFCRQLEGRYRLPVFTMNENLSSVEARYRMDGNTTQNPLDAYAAQVILESWIEEHS